LSFGSHECSGYMYYLPPQQKRAGAGRLRIHGKLLDTILFPEPPLLVLQTLYNP
jgi:hypothetical protein